MEGVPEDVKKPKFTVIEGGIVNEKTIGNEGDTEALLDAARNSEEPDNYEFKTITAVESPKEDGIEKGTQDLIDIAGSDPDSDKFHFNTPDEKNKNT
ncbi:MAG: hypothetical protein ACI9BF_000878 [Candidatus Paceibacteria bacterium]|jgi:hypothetical protein